MLSLWTALRGEICLGRLKKSVYVLRKYKPDEVRFLPPMLWAGCATPNLFLRSSFFALLWLAGAPPPNLANLSCLLALLGASSLVLLALAGLGGVTGPNLASLSFFFSAFNSGISMPNLLARSIFFCTSTLAVLLSVHMPELPVGDFGPSQNVILWPSFSHQ